jgi:hypothetical protein
MFSAGILPIFTTSKVISIDSSGPHLYRDAVSTTNKAKEFIVI